MGSIIKWLPRVMTLILIAFAIMFALYGFIPGGTGYNNSTALIIGFLPAVILLLVLILGWFYKMAGGIAFIIIGLFMTFFFNSMKRDLSFLSLALPVMVVGILFLLSHYYEKPSRGR